MFRIVSSQFGYPMYASLDSQQWSDQEHDAVTYGPLDNREIKLPFWRGVAITCGLDPSCVSIVEVQ